MIRPGIRRLFRLALPHREAIRRDVDEEVALHLALRAEQLERQGEAHRDAVREANRRFGDLALRSNHLYTAAHRREQEMQRRETWQVWRQDIGYAWRSLRSHPTFALTAIISLALGVGVNVALFTLINGILLRPLPFPDAGDLYRAWSVDRAGGLDRAWTSPVTFADWRAGRTRIADMGGYFVIPGGTGLDLGGTAEPQRFSGAFITDGFFSTLGVKPIAGRLPRPDELGRGGDNHVVVLSFAAWSRYFAQSRGLIDSTVMLSGAPYRVVGVMPRTFHFPSDAIDVYVPYGTLTEEMVPWSREVHTLSLIVRGRPGMTAAAVHGEMRLLAQRGARVHAEEAGWDDVALAPMQATMTGSARTPLLVLAGGVAFLLVMACINLASLLLARGAMREREIAIRVALGASRWRVTRQLLTESVLLGIGGGVASIAIARLIIPALAGSGVASVPMHPEIRFGVASLGVAIALSAVTVLIFGLVPAWRSASADPQEALRQGGRSATSGASHRLRTGLVIGEVALAFVLGTGAALMLRTFAHLTGEDLGFRRDRLVVAGLHIDIGRHPNADQQFVKYYQQLLARLRAEPGLQDVAAIRTPPLEAGGEDVAFRTAAMPARPANQLPTAGNFPVSDGYFRAMGIPVLQGREFTAGDTPDGVPVAVVSEAFARKYFSGVSAIDQTLLIGGARPFRIVGVVGDVRQTSISDPPAPLIYFAYAQGMRAQVTFVARSTQPVAALATIRRAIHDVDPQQTITSLGTFENLRSDVLAPARLLALLLGVFGAVALLLGATGVYGVLAALVAARRREIGVRVALGAEPLRVAALVFRQAVVMTGAGLVAGGAGAWTAAHLLASELYHVAPHDPASFALVGVLLLTASGLAGWLPARRALRIPPLEALRE